MGDQGKVSHSSSSWCPKLFSSNNDDEFKTADEDIKADYNRARILRNELQIMCFLSIATSALALGQIFSCLVKGERIIVLCAGENAVLRICFVAIILLIGLRDLQQITINLFVRISGAMGQA